MRVYWEVWRVEGENEFLVGTTESFDIETLKDIPEAITAERYALAQQSRDEFGDLDIHYRLTREEDDATVVEMTTSPIQFP